MKVYESYALCGASDGSRNRVCDLDRCVVMPYVRTVQLIVREWQLARHSRLSLECWSAAATLLLVLLVVGANGSTTVVVKGAVCLRIM